MHSVGHIEMVSRFLEKRGRRLLQIIIMAIFGLGIVLWVSEGFTRIAMAFGLVTLMTALWLVYKERLFLAAAIVLSNLMVMISSLVWVSGGIHDIAMLAYPSLLMFAATLANRRIFITLLIVIMAYCSLVAYLTIHGYFVEKIPTVGYTQLIFINVILLLTGLSVYLLFRDMEHLSISLHEENARVNEREQMIISLANQDLLTGLPNRRFAKDYVENFLINEHDPNEYLAMFFFDLDNFKPVNDSLGHSAGDILLTQLSERLKSVCEPNDIMCRFGGDEFLWIKKIQAENIEELQIRVSMYAQDLLASVAPSFFVLQNQVDISGSIGIALSPNDGCSFEELCRSADLAMYNAKAKGRNTYSFYSAELDRRSVDRFHLFMRLREAIRNHEFQLFYQPKCNLKDGKIIGAEALIRWPQADGSFISPDKFIPLAESSGLIVDIGRWVIEQACNDYLRWSKEGFSTVAVAVNVSSIQFRDGSLLRYTEQLLSQIEMPANRLEFELTESLLITENDNVQRQIDQINQMGILLAIDDFGTGYSNLGYLRRFHAARIKIDKSFVSALGVSHRDEPLVRAMVQMASSLGLMTVAEGIEDEVSLQKLQAIGCTEGQGYYWSPALPMEKWLAYLRSHEAL